jgi:hypothetical protein
MIDENSSGSWEFGMKVGKFFHYFKHASGAANPKLVPSYIFLS